MPTVVEVAQPFVDILAKLNELVTALKIAEDDLDTAYEERNLLVLVFAKIFPAFMSEDPHGDPGYTWLVSIDFPTHLLMSWHIADAQVPLFSFLSIETLPDDTSNSEEEYDRLSALSDTELKGVICGIA